MMGSCRFLIFIQMAIEKTIWLEKGIEFIFFFACIHVFSFSFFFIVLVNIKKTLKPRGESVTHFTQVKIENPVNAIWDYLRKIQ